MVLKKIALTGASGMVGRHLLSVLEERGMECVCSSRQRPHRLPAQFSWSSWNLEEWKDLKQLDDIFPDAQALIHAGAAVPKAGASQSQRELFDANVRSCLCLGQWALHKEIPLIFISGATVYADPKRTGIKESDPKTRGGLGGLYGISKLWAEEIFNYLEKSGLKLIILRPSSIYGFGLFSDKLVAQFLRLAAADSVIPLEPPVDDKFNLIHASDVAEAALDALEREAWGVFNIATPTEFSMMEIAQTCIEVAGKGSVSVNKRANVHRSPEIQFGLCTDAAKRAFNFHAKYDLNRGVDKMWNDIRLKEREVVSEGMMRS